MALIHLVLSHLALVLVHLDPIAFGMKAELAVIEAHAAAGQTAGALMHVILVLESRGHLFEVAAPLLDVDHADFMTRAFLDVAEFGLAGLAPEFLPHLEGSGRKIATSKV